MFKIPAGYDAWCMLCGKGFKTADGLYKHNKEQKDEHAKRSGQKKPDKKPTTSF